MNRKLRNTIIATLSTLYVSLLVAHGWVFFHLWNGYGYWVWVGGGSSSGSW